MSNHAHAKRKGGQPLKALAGVLLCWIAVRAVLIDLPFEKPLTTVDEAGRWVVTTKSSQHIGIAAAPRAIATARPSHARLLPPSPTQGALLPALAPVPLAVSYPSLARDRGLAPPGAARLAAGHNLLWMVAMGGLPLLANLDSTGRAFAPAMPVQPMRTSVARPGRWSGDAWIVWRSGGSVLVPGPITPVYGGSQAGAVLRYDLAEGSRHRPAVYLRAVRAFDGGRDGDVAAGLALRPLARLPITAHAEVRASPRGVRPAAFVAGGFDEAPLAAGVVARGYAQAGYVGGHDATAFVDGNTIAEGVAWRGRDATVSGGAGAWGGAQRGATRLDLGPTASLRFRLGEGTARLSADYRLRVAGNAEPAAGAAVTLSAGF